MSSAQHRLFSRYIKGLPAGELTWIGLRPARKEDMMVVDSTQAIAELGWVITAWIKRQGLGDYGGDDGPWGFVFEGGAVW